MGLVFGSEETHRRMHDVCEALGLTPPAVKALTSLQVGVAKPMRVLASEWRCDASWVTSLIDTLEERGMVERRVLPADRRVKTIMLTEVGEKAKQEMFDRMAEPPAAMAALTKDEQRTLRDLMAKLQAATDAET